MNTKKEKERKMELKDYIKFENRYFEKMVGCETWEEFTSMRNRYIQFVINCCRWQKVKAISRKRYKGLNNARTKHFAYEAKYLPFDRNKIELYEKYQLGCCHKRRNTPNSGHRVANYPLSPQKGIITHPNKNNG